MEYTVPLFQKHQKRRGLYEGRHRRRRKRENWGDRFRIFGLRVSSFFVISFIAFSFA